MTITRAWSGVAALRLTALYAISLIAVSVTLTTLGPQARDAAVSRMSTNLHNLSHGRLTTLVGSAFVEGGAVYAWLPLLVCLLALGEMIWRSKGLLVAFAAGHIGATLLVALWLLAAVKSGWVPVSVTRASDVGISYGAVSVLGALTTSIPARWRSIWVGWWIGTAAVVAWAAAFDFTAIGHILSLLLGVGVSWRLPALARWSRAHVMLLANGAVLGYFMVSGWSIVAPLGGLAGLLLAVLVSPNVWSRSESAPALAQSMPCRNLSPVSP